MAEMAEMVEKVQEMTRSDQGGLLLRLPGVFQGRREGTYAGKELYDNHAV